MRTPFFPVCMVIVVRQCHRGPGSNAGKEKKEKANRVPLDEVFYNTSLLLLYCPCRVILF